MWRYLLILGLVHLCLGQYGHQGHHGNRRQAEQKPQINPYKVLGIKQDATPAEIKKAYRKLGLKYHPDKNKAKDARVKMQEVNNAFEMISDPDAKAIYDEFGGGEKYFDRWQYMQSRRGQELAKKDFYTHSEDVTTLDMKNFYQTVRTKPHLVNFYAPWCGHCQEMVPKFKRTAVLMTGIVSLGAVNCEKHQALCGQQQVRSYPTLRFYHPVERGQEQEVEVFEGGHDPEDIYSWVQQSLSNELVQLNRDNFHQLVKSSDDLWLVDFSAGAWCGPCQALKPHVRRTANSMKGIVRVGIVNCDQDRDFCNEFNGQYYPQLRLFKADKTPDEGQLLEAEQHNPAVGMLGLIETLIPLIYTPPPTPDIHDDQISSKEEDPELSDDEIIDDVNVDDDTRKEEL